MVLQTLLLLNVTVSIFLTGHPGSLTFTTDHSTPPDTSINFGDGTFQEKSLVTCRLDKESLSSICTTNHTYRDPGLYTIRLHVSETEYREVEVAVEDPIEGVQLTLVSPSPLLALLEEVVVECTVEKGTNLTFEWDFGDETDGQYTMVESFDLSSTAHHSYGLADTYNVSVVIRSPLQSFLTILNITLRAVEPIERLHLQPLSGRFAAPLLRPASTVEVAFEAWAWKGSDVEFEFDFGDGERAVVPAELNEWDMPWALVTHRYTEEGAFWVCVTAMNPLDWVNETLQHPFYVQFPPEDLRLDQSYYAIRSGADLQLHATVASGSDVYFDFHVGDDFRLNSTEGNLTVPSMEAGNYMAHVEAFNQVTEQAYAGIERPSASARVYVQEVLLNLTLCVKRSNGTVVCDASELELPLDEEIRFRAETVPSVESTLRFVWHLGLPELKRTNDPNLDHRYPDAGRYHVNVTAQNLVSAVASPHLLIHVVQRVSNLTAVYSPDATLVGRNVTLQARYWFGSDLTFHWRFGDGSPDVRTRVATVQHVFHRAGEYWVSVKAWNRFSQAEVSTNLFFLDRVCQKPDIVFLNDGQTQEATSDEDVLIEANVGISCPGANASYSWTVTETSSGVPMNLTLAGIPSQRQLILPRGLLHSGHYDVRLKVALVGTIVYSSASTALQIRSRESLAVIGGGFVRVVGRNDTLEMKAEVDPSQRRAWNYRWSCTPLATNQPSCFVGDPLPSNKSRFLLPATLLHPALLAVEMNVSIGTGETQLHTSQVVEIAPEPHTLIISLECVSCREHRVRGDERVVLRASSPDDPGVRYRWSLWLVQQAEDDSFITNQDCVPADGSTFFILAPNATEDTTSDSSNPLLEQTTSETTHDFQDGPPFPLFHEFPELNFLREFKMKENPRPSTPPHPLSFHRMPVEGEDVYDDNDTLIDFPYPEFLPRGEELPLGSPAHLIPEEGIPGESGSAHARDQRTHDFNGAFPDEEDDESILEGAGKSRILPHVANGLLPDVSGIVGDPLRNEDAGPRLTHLVHRPRLRVSTHASDSSTGLESRYLVLKPGVLRGGATYLIRVDAEADGHTQLIGSATEYLRVRPGPTHGRCSLLPAGDSFRLHCLEWRARGPLTYALRYALDPDQRGHLLYFGYSSNLKFQLPAGKVESNHSVYVNVAVQEHEGAVTNVCSLVRQVFPRHLNTSLEHYIYNESAHPNSTLRRLEGEGQVQALLGRMHVLVTSLNNAPSPGDLELRKKIRLLHLDILAALPVFSKVEAVQMLSVLSEMISDEISNLSAHELERCYAVFLQIYRSKQKLYAACPPRALERGIETFLSRLAFHASARGSPQLVAAAQDLLEKEIKETIQFDLVPMEPYQIEIRHYFARAVHLARTDSTLRDGLVPLKKTRLLLPEESHLDSLPRISDHQQINGCHNCNRKRNCSIMIAKEWDYVENTFLERQLMPFHNLEKISTSVTFYSCDSFQLVGLKGDSEFTTHFPRTPLEVDNMTTLTTGVMNIHSIDLADDIRPSLVFHVTLEPTNDSESDFSFEVLFRRKDPPSPEKYDLKKIYSSRTSEVNFFVSELHLKEPGPYHFAVLDARRKSPKQTTSIRYRLRIWKQVCLGKTDVVWRSDVCRGVESSNHLWMHCRCSTLQMYAYSIPTHSSVRFVAMDIVPRPYNAIPAIALLVLLIVYSVLLVVHCRRDELKCSASSPVPLRDNSVSHQQMYVMQVRTGSRASSGTTSSVFVVLHGVSGLTETRQLIGCGQKRILLQRGSVDTFLMSTYGNLGPLISLEIWHDNSGPSPAWYLVDVTVKDASTGHVYRFACNDWLSAEKGDGLVEREIAVSETAPVLAELFPEALRRSWGEYHVWNSVFCDSVASPLTGAQKVTSCLSFVLNSAVLLLIFGGDVIGRLVDPLPQSVTTTLLLGVTAFLLCSIPQTIVILLLRFSTPVRWHPSSRLQQFLRAVPPCSPRCWWRKRTEEFSISGSARESVDSLYSSSEASSRCDLFGEGSEVRDPSDEQLSASSFDMNDPVSPLQKTLSTWQVVESWVRRKNDGLLNQEPKQLSAKDQSLQRAFPRSSLSNVDSDVKSSLTSLGDSRPSPASGSAISDEMDPSRLNVDWSSSFRLSPVWFCGAWMLLGLDVVLSAGFFLAQASRMENQDLVLLLQGVFISVSCSCCVLHPIIVLLAAVTSSARELWFWRHRDLAHDGTASPGGAPCELISRIEYFKQYLRPPKEPVLHEFRRVALREGNLTTFIRRGGKQLLLLVLLCGLAWPDDIASCYSQRTAILKAFSSRDSTVPDTPEALWNSMKNFLSVNFVCPNPTHRECLFASHTGCQPVGIPVLRYPRVLESTGASIRYDVPEMDQIEPFLPSDHQQTIRIISDNWFNHSDIRLELILFNPTTSFLILVSLDVMSWRLPTPIITVSSVQLQDDTVSCHIHHLLQLIIFIITLASIKNLTRGMIEKKMKGLKPVEFYLGIVFTLLSILYLIGAICSMIFVSATLDQVKSDLASASSDLVIAAFCQSCVRGLLGVLIFLHLIGMMRLFSYKQHWHLILRRLADSSKGILPLCAVFLLFMLLFSFVSKIVDVQSIQARHLTWLSLSAVNVILKHHRNAVLTESTHPTDMVLLLLFVSAVVAFHVCFIALVRVFFLRWRSRNDHDAKTWKINDLRRVVKRKMNKYLTSNAPQVVPRDETALPMEFLLFELEHLADKLVQKADILFADIQPSNVVCEDRSDSDRSDEMVSQMTERASTLPLPNDHQWRENFTCRSLTMQTRLRRKQQTCRIRKTYPLTQACSNSSSDSDGEPAGESVLRRTKSKGKDRKCDLEVEAVDSSV